MTDGPFGRAGASMGSLRQIVAFCMVGAAATVTHFGVVVMLVPLGIAALAANVVGFLCAFGLSYVGHGSWTFPAAGDRDRLRALHRFFRVALLGFAANESLFWLLLSRTSLPYQVALIIVLAVVAGGTLLLSKYWAFADG